MGRVHPASTLAQCSQVESSMTKSSIPHPCMRTTVPGRWLETSGIGPTTHSLPDGWSNRFLRSNTLWRLLLPEWSAFASWVAINTVRRRAARAATIQYLGLGLGDSLAKRGLVDGSVRYNWKSGLQDPQHARGPLWLPRLQRGFSTWRRLSTSSRHE